MAFGDTGILDNFNRANEGPPMTGWADILSGLIVSSNQCTLSASGSRISYYNTVLTAADCEVFATVATPPTTNRTMAVFARLVDIGASTTDGYGIRYYSLGTSVLRIFRLDDGTETTLGADITQTLVSGDKFGLEIIGDTLTAYVDTGSGWTSAGSRTDSNHAAAGYIGAGIAGNGTIDDFGGGELVASGDSLAPVLSRIRQQRAAYIRM